MRFDRCGYDHAEFSPPFAPKIVRREASSDAEESKEQGEDARLSDPRRSTSLFIVVPADAFVRAFDGMPLRPQFLSQLCKMASAVS